MVTSASNEVLPTLLEIFLTPFHTVFSLIFAMNLWPAEDKSRTINPLGRYRLKPTKKYGMRFLHQNIFLVIFHTAEIQKHCGEKRYLLLQAICLGYTPDLISLYSPPPFVSSIPSAAKRGKRGNHISQQRLKPNLNREEGNDDAKSIKAGTRSKGAGLKRRIGANPDAARFFCAVYWDSLQAHGQPLHL